MAQEATLKLRLNSGADSSPVVEVVDDLKAMQPKVWGHIGSIERLWDEGTLPVPDSAPGHPSAPFWNCSNNPRQVEKATDQ